MEGIAVSENTLYVDDEVEDDITDEQVLDEAEDEVEVQILLGYLETEFLDNETVDDAEVGIVALEDDDEVDDIDEFDVIDAAEIDECEY